MRCQRDGRLGALNHPGREGVDPVQLQADQLTLAQPGPGEGSGTTANRDGIRSRTAAGTQLVSAGGRRGPVALR